MDGGLHWLRPLRLLMGDAAEVCAVTSRSAVVGMDAG
eukprot:gene35810-8150_t